MNFDDTNANGTLSERLDAVRSRIATACAQCGRDAAAVTLMAVSKTVPIAVISQAYQHGATVFGENRVQEARDKIAALPDVRWELIGPLQRNKVRLAVGLFTRIQTVASVELADEIERVAAARGLIVPVLIEVNVSAESTKHGVTPAATMDLAWHVAKQPHLRGEGLMTVAPQTDDPETVRPVFAQLRQLRDSIHAAIGPEWNELSMGMSNDYAVAVAEGATLIRVGRAIFGDRPQK